MSLPMSGNLDAHYEMIIKAITGGLVVPFLGAGANLCDRPEELTWSCGQCEHLPNGSELAAHLADNFGYPSRETQGICSSCNSEVCLAERMQDLVRVSQYVAIIMGLGPIRFTLG
jgi:hypothetical protein